jgi:hypothetical protein
MAKNADLMTTFATYDLWWKILIKDALSPADLGQPYQTATLHDMNRNLMWHLHSVLYLCNMRRKRLGPLRVARYYVGLVA